MGPTMKERHGATRQLAVEYKRATKKERGEILDSVIQLTGCSRSCATRVLRQRAKLKVMGRPKQDGIQATLIEDERTKRRKKPQRQVGESTAKDVVVAVQRIWVICDGIRGERLRALPGRDCPDAGTIGRVDGRR